MHQPVLLSRQQQLTIDRRFVEYPTGFELKPYIENLNAPTAIAFDSDGALLVAEGGFGDYEPRIFGFRRDGKRFDIYPVGRKIPFLRTGFRIYGPVGGMFVDRGHIYVTHRDAEDRGVITAFEYDGSHSTVVADLPAEGDYGVTDIAMGPNGRLYFGVGAATNSGVVGLDNWEVGWVDDHPKFCDRPATELKLLGYRFDAANPRAGLFGGEDIARTAPFQPFGQSIQTRIPAAPNDKPTAAVYSVNPSGGGLKVEAHGVRYPRGLAFTDFGNLYMTDDGMELRGTRPVMDDPDTLLRVIANTWYGWPDYSADLFPISDARFQSRWAELLLRSGYPDLSFVIDHATSGLIPPDRSALLAATFQPLSGAAKLAFVPATGPFKQYAGNAIVALAGDRAPFATSGKKLAGPVGYKVVRVDVGENKTWDFVRNTVGGPASRIKGEQIGLERPIDVKFGPDGALYILDMGQITMDGGQARIKPGTGRVFRLEPMSEPVTTDSSDAAQ